MHPLNRQPPSEIAASIFDFLTSKKECVFFTLNYAQFMTTVDEYIAQLPPETASMLNKIRKAILEAAPKAEEGIAYDMPSYHYQGPLIYFGAYKNHCSLFGTSKAILARFKEELSAFKISGASTIQFTVSNPLPAALVKKIVKARVEENENKKIKPS